MPLTPGDVDNVEFPPPPAGVRGYDEGEVDAFLDTVAAEMRKLAAENAQMRRLTAASPAGDELAELNERLLRLRESCARAERDARAVQADLERARAQQQGPGAPGFAGVLELARRTADDHLAEAQQEAEALLRQASTKAGQLTSDAELRASTQIADARHQHAERIAGIADKRAAALDEIADLTTFARQYRESLGNLLKDRLDELIGKPRPEKLTAEAPAARSA